MNWLVLHYEPVAPVEIKRHKRRGKSDFRAENHSKVFRDHKISKGNRQSYPGLRWDEEKQILILIVQTVLAPDSQ